MDGGGRELLLGASAVLGSCPDSVGDGVGVVLGQFGEQAGEVGGEWVPDVDGAVVVEDRLAFGQGP
jgi:hypothetical protein